MLINVHNFFFKSGAARLHFEGWLESEKVEITVPQVKQMHYTANCYQEEKMGQKEKETISLFQPKKKSSTLKEN